MKGIHHNACSHCTTGSCRDLILHCCWDMEDPVTYETEMAQVQNRLKKQLLQGVIS
jgi:hypothetical protein